LPDCLECRGIELRTRGLHHVQIPNLAFLVDGCGENDRTKRSVGGKEFFWKP
jgi:hypothetical protein